jgi:hypothetical protein
MVEGGFRGKGRLFVAGLAAGGLIATAGCTASGSESRVEHKPSGKPTISAVVPRVTENPTAQPMTLQGYERSDQRTKKISAVVRRFGQQLVNQFKKSGAGPMGALDAFCAPANGNIGPEGYTSQGFKPQSGDQCYIQHSPSSGGEPIQVGATVLVGPKTNAFVDIVGISVNTPDGVATIANYNPSTGWQVDYGRTFEQDLAEIQNPPSTVAGAQKIDNEALALFNETQA